MLTEIKTTVRIHYRKSLGYNKETCTWKLHEGRLLGVLRKANYNQTLEMRSES